MGWVELVVMLAMIGFNAVFAGYELSLAAVSQGRLRVLAEQGRRGAAAAVYMKENVEASLSAVQLGITLFGAVAAATGGAGAEEAVAPWLRDRFGLSEGLSEFLAVAAVVLPLTAVTIVLGELVPKVYALRNQERVCLALSPAMKWFTFSVWPAVWLFETSASAVADWGDRRLRRADGDVKPEAVELQELRAAATLARAGRLIGAREENIIVAAARLPGRAIGEIMIPAANISLLDATARPADAMIAAHLDMHTRYPVTERAGDPQGVIGYANFKDLVAVLRFSPNDPTIRSLVRPIHTFADTDSIAHCLEHLLRANAHIALVRSAAGPVVGMITLEDIVEELLGDIGDEFDRLPDHVTASGPAWAVGGGAALDRVRAETGLELPGDGTFADWFEGQLGRPPRGGDVLVRDGFRAAVRRVRRRRVVEAVLVRR